MVQVHTDSSIVQLGRRLFMALVKAQPASKSAFSLDTPFAYDFHIQFEDQATGTLQKSRTHKLSELINFKDISYIQGSPVFVIPESRSRYTEFLYGSCRKPHGPGEDALIAGDKVMRFNWSLYKKKLTKPPLTVLCFLGDQIYADDVKDNVFNRVRQLSKAIMGYAETIPEYPNAVAPSFGLFGPFLDNYLQGANGYDIRNINLLTHVAYFPDLSIKHRRENVIKCLKAYFSTNYELSNPLLLKRFYDHFKSFRKGKITGSQLLSNALELSGDSRSKIDPLEILPPFYMQKRLNSKLKPVSGISHNNRLPFIRKNASLSTGDKGHLLSFGEYAAMYLWVWGSPEQGDIRNSEIRRLMANVTSYMIFDDHDVTDDWNIDASWRKRVEASKTGRRIVSNALAAYWAFQAWGNNPDVFDQDFIKTVSDFLVAPLSTNQLPSQSNQANGFENTLISFDKWYFIAPTKPKSLFLDTRTMRGRDERMTYNPVLNDFKKYKAVRLLSPEAIQNIRKLFIDTNFRKGRDPIIICAPGPVLGSTLFEQGQLEFVDGTFNKKYWLVTQGNFQNPGRYKHDFENWKSNPRSKYDLLHLLDNYVKPTDIIILSGDVHYGFDLKANFFSNDTKKVYPIHQFTSSALKNNISKYFAKINKLDKVSYTIDTTEKKYKILNELYPDPRVHNAFLPKDQKYWLKGHLRKYNKLIDVKSWLVQRNNLGFLRLTRKHRSLNLTNHFLHIDKNKRIKIAALDK